MLASSGPGKFDGAAGKTEKVLVMIGNNGAPVSIAGPNYDVILTARTPAGPVICTAGYAGATTDGERSATDPAGLPPPIPRTHWKTGG